MAYCLSLSKHAFSKIIWFGWSTRKDGSKVDLRQVFRDGLFNYSLPFQRNPDGMIHFLDDGYGHKEGYYPARARFGNQIPIEYLWAAKNRLDNYPTKVLLEKHKWCDYAQKTRRITDEELNLMGLKLCMALELIERSLTIRNRRLGKKPIAIPTIANVFTRRRYIGAWLQRIS